MRRGLGSRARWWSVAATVFVLVLVYLVGWAGYAYVHTPNAVRYEVLEPGAVAETPSVSIRLVSMTAAAELADQKYGREPTLPPAHAIWVVAELEVTTHPVDGDPVCNLWLIGPDRRRWQQQSLLSGRTLPTYCIDDSIVPGRPGRIEAVYAVPERYAGELVGLGVFSVDSAARAAVLRPS